MRNNNAQGIIKQTATKIKSGMSGFLRTLTRLNWLGRGILIGIVLLIGVAITLIVVLPVQTQPPDHQAALPTPSATATFEPTLAPPTQTPVQTTKPEPTIDPVLEKGDEGPYVKALQEQLMDLGYMEIDDSTLFFGPATKYAFELFQRQHNLQQDGIAGTETLDMIFAPDAKKYTLLEGTKGSDVDGM